ncbi:hypothetical protein GGR55DRAFT_338706 [Xylaria sp. FL0064]|nr:hypothetical protein GGR55DRAFT_338706 [Xylaria sp. FL0064]
MIYRNLNFSLPIPVVLFQPTTYTTYFHCCLLFVFPFFLPLRHRDHGTLPACLPTYRPIATYRGRLRVCARLWLHFFPLVPFVWSTPQIHPIVCQKEYVRCSGTRGICCTQESRNRTTLDLSFSPFLVLLSAAQPFYLLYSSHFAGIQRALLLVHRSTPLIIRLFIYCPSIHTPIFSSIRLCIRSFTPLESEP